jgi:hypothetical protein
MRDGIDARTFGHDQGLIHVDEDKRKRERMASATRQNPHTVGVGEETQRYHHLCSSKQGILPRQHLGTI